MRFNLALLSAVIAAAATLGAIPGAIAQAAQAIQKVIKDPAEYNAYMAALGLTDPAKKAAAMEVFVQTYPSSVVVSDALAQTMGAYQAAGNVALLASVAQRLLVLEPANVRVLAVLTALESAPAEGGDPKALADMRDHAERGLRNLPTWPRADGQSEAEFSAQRTQMEAIFDGAIGFARLNDKNYAGARDVYLKAFAINPADLQVVYQLGIAELQMSPLELNGFWHLARAFNLAVAQTNQTAQEAISKYAIAKYKHYHGGADGWDAIVAAAGASSSIPAGFAASIKPAPTPAELAVNAVNENDVASLSFSDWEYVLSYRDASPANAAAAAKVWAAIQSVQKGGAAKLNLPITVISATTSTIEAAISDDNIQARKADLHVALENPLKDPPKAGSTLSVTGLITAYQPKPFMFMMTQGLLSAATP